MRTLDEKRRIVEEAMAPGASVAGVARKHGVNANLLFGWRRLHKRGLLDGTASPAALLPVTVTTPTLLPDRGSRPAARPSREPRRSRADRVESEAGHVEVRLPDGVTVRVQGRVDREALAAVLAVLRAR
jgi:transposase